MHAAMSSISNIMFIHLFILSFISPSYADPRATLAGRVCTNRTAQGPSRNIFINNFLSAMDAISPLIASQRYGTVIKGTGNNTVYILGECMKDLSQTDCEQCFAQCKTDILRCLPFQLAVRGGRNYFDGCFLRYDDYDFFKESLSPKDEAVCGGRDFRGNQTIYGAIVRELVRNLSIEGPKNSGFSVGSLSSGNITVYGLSQCWESIDRNSCERCLENATLRIQSCSQKEEGRVLNAGCYLRFSPERFYNQSDTNASGGGGGGRRLAIILAAVCSGLAALVILTSGIFFGKRKLAKREERKQLGALAATLRKSDLNFKYEILEKATKYFNDSTKLGQGGSGSVYKGTLPDGKIVAVKRLIFSTRQWVDQFFNEVNLISGIHHKNLVKLLGCSIAGPESLLVYEYVPNQSLLDNLFNRNNSHKLNWKERFNVILGTAEGLFYLHEESDLRIIHRDIKLSNILLDENYTAKIADFGLARLFPENITHISTAIAGTLGYMAPEYVVRGKLTEKADVYSFGVLVVEVVCGRRNNSFNQDSSILQLVWNYYTSARLCDAVDPTLAGNFQEEEASRVLQIGLLCTQASPELRPSMSTVVKLLTSDHDIPQSTPPPFLSSSSTSSSSLPPEIWQPESDSRSSGNNLTLSRIEPR
ncbi:hypothetical protein IFM89_014079 [Coptis chinensis]|uniref:Cysteine-rich receptor-like protein kinase 3 n=1 Tax=Coptis chinensis TaxID=261450 RepID=A0A835MIB7_9MAGN|nr:hypothetical protein IFM89_014079 [Coptis chinensis]